MRPGRRGRNRLCTNGRFGQGGHRALPARRRFYVLRKRSAEGSCTEGSHAQTLQHSLCKLASQLSARDTLASSSLSSCKASWRLRACDVSELSSVSAERARRQLCRAGRRSNGFLLVPLAPSQLPRRPERSFVHCKASHAVSDLALDRFNGQQKLAPSSLTVAVWPTFLRAAGQSPARPHHRRHESGKRKLQSRQRTAPQTQAGTSASCTAWAVQPHSRSALGSARQLARPAPELCIPARTPARVFLHTREAIGGGRTRHLRAYRLSIPHVRMPLDTELAMHRRSLARPARSQADSRHARVGASPP